MVKKGKTEQIFVFLTFSEKNEKINEIDQKRKTEQTLAFFLPYTEKKTKEK